MSNSKNKGSSFLVQGSILAIASIISRIIGLIYRIPMTDIIGDLGNDYYGSAFEIYNILLIISSYSLPIAVSKLVSARMKKRQRRQAYQIFKCAIVFSLISGSIAGIILYFCADYFCELINTPYSVFALKILAPVLVVVALLGVIRGFFQGLGTAVPSAISQVLEQVVNAIVSVWAAYVLFKVGTAKGAVLGDDGDTAAAYGAAGGTLGINIGSLTALVFVLLVLVIYIAVLKRQMRREINAQVDSFTVVMKTLIIAIIPVLLSTALYNCSGIIDQIVFKNIATIQGYTYDEIHYGMGVYAGKYKIMINIPISIASALAAATVPSLTAAYVERDAKEVRGQISAGIRYIMLVAFPCTVILAVLAEPIYAVIFPKSIDTLSLSTHVMWVGAVAVIFFGLSTLTNGILQGLNKLYLPIINAIIALVLHLLLLISLMIFFRLGVYAVVISNAFFGFVMCLLNGRHVRKHSGYRLEIGKAIIIPGLASVIMGLIALGANYGIYYLSKNYLISLIVSFILAFILYIVLIVKLKGLSEAEISAFPLGEKFAGLFKKLKLL